MKLPPDPPAPQGRARHSVRAGGNESDIPVDPRGAQGTDAPHPMDADERTGLPGLRTWSGVYLFVFGCFVLWVVLLLALTASYS
ncbi:MAG: hypothetical protein KGJ60_05865 [Verrucomicrobiota bacterium]|nr:hypothetical protein [Verrucomicrobiota bacterium]MDE3067063.1 hypothetical protein [Verrucomicrobiota bacterium]